MSTDQSRKRWPLRRVSGGTCTLCELDATVRPRDELTSVIDADLKRKNGCALGQLRRNKGNCHQCDATILSALHFVCVASEAGRASS